LYRDNFTFLRLSVTTDTENKELDARQLWCASVYKEILMKPIIIQLGVSHLVIIDSVEVNDVEEEVLSLFQ
jgi:hypothetical protein